MMKSLRILSLFSISLILVLASCKKEENLPSNLEVEYSYLIDGTWNIRKVIIYEYTDSSVRFSDTTQYANGNYTVRFSNGVATFREGGKNPIDKKFSVPEKNRIIFSTPGLEGSEEEFTMNLKAPNLNWQRTIRRTSVVEEYTVYEYVELTR